MEEVAIVGAGELGGALAYLLARRDLASRVRLIDPSGTIAAGKALDIMQAAPITQFATTLSGYADITRAAGARLIVLADRADGTEWNGDEGLQLVAHLAQIASSSVVVCAGASQCELIDLAVRDRLFERSRLFGSAPEALAAAVRAMIALETNGAPAEVSLALMGVPPGQTVIAWEEVTIAGFAATRVLDEPARRRIAGRVAPLWPPGAYALAAAACEAIAGVLGYSRRTISCFVSPEVGGGRRARTAALPVCLGGWGITRTAVPTLSPQVQVALDNSMLL
jgi:malate dehydrogenase